MVQANSKSDSPEVGAGEQPSVSVEDLLEQVSEELNPAESEALSELGIYSIHEHESARTITLPEGAEGFDDTTTVRQYYFHGDDCPLLIVTPLKV